MEENSVSAFEEKACLGICKRLWYLYTLVAYILRVVIFEAPHFTKTITDLMPDDEYRQLQAALIKDPALGDLIQGREACASCAGHCQGGASGAGCG